MLIGSLHHFCMTELLVGGPRSGLTHSEFAAQVVDVMLASVRPNDTDTREGGEGTR
jgi:hypothetical protein